MMMAEEYLFFFRSASAQAIITFVTAIIFQSSRAGNEKTSLALAKVLTSHKCVLGKPHMQSLNKHTHLIHYLNMQTHTYCTCSVASRL